MGAKRGEHLVSCCLGQLETCTYLYCISELSLLNSSFTLCSLQMKIRLKYRFSFVRNGQELVEMGDVSNFPY